MTTHRILGYCVAKLTEIRIAVPWTRTLLNSCKVRLRCGQAEGVGQLESIPSDYRPNRPLFRLLEQRSQRVSDRSPPNCPCAADWATRHNCETQQPAYRRTDCLPVFILTRAGQMSTARLNVTLKWTGSRTALMKVPQCLRTTAHILCSLPDTFQFILRRCVIRSTSTR
jgi:hypothetical protein